MRVVCIVEARMGSTRLPGKMMAEVAEGVTTLEAVVRRLQRCEYAADLVVATSTADDDDVIEAAAADLGVDCFRGSEADVLDRVVECARAHDADVVCRACGDCPLIDPAVVDQLIACFTENENADYVSNLLHPGWPNGLEVEVVAADTLDRVAAVAEDPSHREHVTTYIRERPVAFTQFHLSPPPAFRDPDVKVTLDYPADLELIREVYDRLAERGDPLAAGTAELLAVFDADPDLRTVNAEHRPDG